MDEKQGHNKGKKYQKRLSLYGLNLDDVVKVISKSPKIMMKAKTGTDKSKKIK